MKMFGDTDPIGNRWHINPSGVIGAYIDEKLVGSNVLSRWGTFGWFGPLTVEPKLWDKGIAKRLLERTMEIFSDWGTTLNGLFMFPGSPKHLGLYEKFGFKARFLTPAMNTKVESASPKETGRKNFLKLSDLGTVKSKEKAVRECREFTDLLYDGLDLTSEIQAVGTLGLGEVIMLEDDARTVGFAVCHVGAHTEAGSGKCYVKFGATMLGSNSGRQFRELLSACKAFASVRGVATVRAGVNMARSHAYDEMLASGFRNEFIGVAMHNPNEAGFNRPDVFAIDDCS
jgi:hypothetical protein